MEFNRWSSVDGGNKSGWWSEQINGRERLSLAGVQSMAERGGVWLEFNWWKGWSSQSMEFNPWRERVRGSLTAREISAS